MIVNGVELGNTVKCMTCDAVSFEGNADWMRDTMGLGFFCPSCAKLFTVMEAARVTPNRELTEEEKRTECEVTASDIRNELVDAAADAADVENYVSEEGCVDHAKFIADLRDTIQTLKDLVDTYEKKSAGLDVDYYQDRELHYR